MQTRPNNAAQKSSALAARLNKEARKLESGNGVPVNYAAAITLYEKAMRLNNVSAIYNRGRMYESGLGGRTSYQAAIMCYDKAIELGHLGAMNNRALMHLTGKGGNCDEQAAILLFDRVIQHYSSSNCADQTRLSAMYNRASLYANGESDTYDAANALYEQIISLCEANAMYARPYSSALTNRAQMHLLEKNTPVNDQAAIQLLERAIKLGNARAMYFRATLHLSGTGCPVNLKAGINLLDKSAEQGVLIAIHDRAEMYLNGSSGSVNYPAAITLFDRVFQAVASGCARMHDGYDAVALVGSTRLRARMHVNGQGGPVDFMAAITTYDGIINSNGEPYSGMFSSYYANIMCDRATMHLKGQGGPVDYPAASALYDRAIAYGNTEAMRLRGKMLLEGKGSVANPNAGLRLLLKAELRGNDLAKEELTSLYPASKINTLPDEIINLFQDELDTYAVSLKQYLVNVRERLTEIASQPASSSSLYKQGLPEYLDLAYRELNTLQESMTTNDIIELAARVRAHLKKDTSSFARELLALFNIEFEKNAPRRDNAR